MSVVTNFLQSKLQEKTLPAEEQAVLIYFDNEDLDGSIPLQFKLIELLEPNRNIGMFDGNEVGGGELVLFLYGPDAEVLFKFIEPTLRADEFCRGARVVIRWGGPQAPKRKLVL